MEISIIAAISDNNVIGINNTLPWRLPNDLKRFKEITTGHTIVMGRKTYESFGTPEKRKPLPNRTNIILTTKKDYQVEGAIICHEFLDTVELCFKNKDAKLFAIGGAEIYKQFLKHGADYMYLTVVHTTIENADTFFPEINYDEWELLSEEPHFADEKNEWNYTFKTYKRK